MAEEFRGVDLFGEPIPVVKPRGRGRPEHQWTQEKSHKVSLLFAMGKDEDDAAAMLGISKATLRKHYFSELAGLTAARIRLRAKTWLDLSRAAADGNVAAAKELLKEMERGSMIGAAAFDKQRKAKPPKKGKKEEALEQARNAGRGGKWGGLLDRPAGEA